MPLIETAVALCAVGAEKIVSNELRKLNFTIRESGFGKVRFETNLEGLYRALIALRAADRVLLETAFFPAADFDALFEGTRRVPWEEYIPKEMGLRVAKVRTNRSKLQAETSVQAVVHKAAAERLCAKRGIHRLPEYVDEAELRVYIEKDRVSLLLDLSGEPLFKRGYRTQGGIAPLRETTAAAIILHAGWRRKFPLYDPFCGSGTIAIEAAMYAWDIAPGLRRRFALEELLPHDRRAERQAREEFKAKIDFSRLVRIAGSDSEASAAAAAGANMARALAAAGDRQPPPPVFRTLPMHEARPEGSFAHTGIASARAEESFARHEFSGARTEIPSARTEEPFARHEFSGAWTAGGVPGGNTSGEDAPRAEGFIITNPPYGRRLGDAEFAERTYTEMRRLAENFPGWKLALITDHPGFESFFGRKADSCREITNGAIRSYLYQYEKL